MQLRSIILALGVVSPCLALLRTPPAKNVLSSHLDSVCELNSVSKGPLPYALAFGDVAFDTAGVVNTSSTPAADKKAEWKDAMQNYKATSKKMQAAEQRLMQSMDALLEVPKADPAQLSSFVSEKKSNTLVVFYAPWCGHCQTFVLHDGSGDPTKSPLEAFKKDLAKDDTTKEVGVVRVDVQEHGESIPAPYEVEFIPTVYFVNKKGEAKKYAGNPGDLTALKSFVTTNSVA